MLSHCAAGNARKGVTPARSSKLASTQTASQSPQHTQALQAHTSNNTNTHTIRTNSSSSSRKQGHTSTDFRPPGGRRCTTASIATTRPAHRPADAHSMFSAGAAAGRRGRVVEGGKALKGEQGWRAASEGVRYAERQSVSQSVSSQYRGTAGTASKSAGRRAGKGRQSAQEDSQSRQAKARQAESKPGRRAPWSRRTGISTWVAPPAQLVTVQPVCVAQEHVQRQQAAQILGCLV